MDFDCATVDCQQLNSKKINISHCAISCDGSTTKPCDFIVCMDMIEGPRSAAQPWVIYDRHIPRSRPTIESNSSQGLKINPCPTTPSRARDPDLAFPGDLIAVGLMLILTTHCSPQSSQKGRHQSTWTLPF